MLIFFSMERFIDRLDMFMSREGLNPNQVTVKAGLSVGLIAKCRKNGSGMASDSIEKILCAYPSLSADWLITGRGDMYKDEREAAPVATALPLLPMEAVAGHGSPVYDDEKAEALYSVSEFKDCDFLIRVKGDSMSPKFTGGDLLACKKVVDAYFFQWGRVYVLLTQSQGCMVKRIQPSENEDCVRCVSENPKYAPFDVPKSDIVSVALVNGAISLE